MRFKSLMILLMLLIIGAAVLFCIYGDEYSFTQKYYYRVFGGWLTNSSLSINTPRVVAGLLPSNTQPPTYSEWCKPQAIATKSDIEEPLSIAVTGWDIVSDCCIKEYRGYDCALHHNIILNLCYTSDIGGEIKYVTVDGTMVDPAKYNIFIQNLDKDSITNKQCDNSIYPQTMR